MILAQFNDADLPKVRQWLNDERLMYYMSIESPGQIAPVSFAVRSHEELIGWSTIFNIDLDNKKAEFGMALPGQHGVRVGGFATIKTLQYAFNVLQLNRIYVRPLASNVLHDDPRERFGFVREGIERQSVWRNGKSEDVIIMSILKDEFQARWGKCQQFHT